MGQRTAGDLMFEGYLAEQGYGPVPHEPDLGVGKRPDYVIERDGQRCVVEVKEFAEDSSPFKGSSGTFDSRAMHKPIRGQIREAAHQLKPLAGQGLPLVVMLTNPRGVLLDLSVESLVHSMYGDLTYTFPVSPETGGATAPGQFIAGRNGKLRTDHQYISGVGLVSQRDRGREFIDAMRQEHADLSLADFQALIDEADERDEIPTGFYSVVTLVKSASEEAVEVPGVFFAGARDRVFEHDEQQGLFLVR